MGLENLPDITTTKELAEFMRMSESTIHRAVADGELKALKIGRSVRYERAAVINWINKEE